jgi:hypothetical protein
MINETDAMSAAYAAASLSGPPPETGSTARHRHATDTVARPGGDVGYTAEPLVHTATVDCVRYVAAEGAQRLRALPEDTLALPEHRRVVRDGGRGVGEGRPGVGGRRRAGRGLGLDERRGPRDTLASRAKLRDRAAHGGGAAGAGYHALARVAVEARDAGGRLEGRARPAVAVRRGMGRVLARGAAVRLGLFGHGGRFVARRAPREGGHERERMSPGTTRARLGESARLSYCRESISIHARRTGE